MTAEHRAVVWDRRSPTDGPPGQVPRCCRCGTTRKPVAPALNEGELAWQLASVVTVHLKRTIRSRTYLLLGCGDHYDAIIRLLEQMRVRGIELPATLQKQIETWVAGYRGTTVEPSLRALVNAVSTAKHQLSEPVSASDDAAPAASCAAPTDVVTSP